MNSIKYYIDINLNDTPPRKKGKNASKTNYEIREQKAIDQADPIKHPNLFTIDEIISLVNHFLDTHGIKQDNKLLDKSDFIWLKFTEDKYLGVVASGYDFNFSDKFISGCLITKVEKKWDTTSLAVFPLSHMPRPYKIKDIEKAIGNYLIENKVPIIDFYSHIY